MKTVIFDLDGTLVDSAPGILAALEAAFSTIGRAPVCPLERAIIGPPLRETITMLVEKNDREKVADLMAVFKDRYDSDTYRKTLVFDGVEPMLAEISRRGYQMFIATNKRIEPTRSILQHLGWNKLFEAVYALDSFPIPVQSKAEMLETIILERKLAPQSCVYVGDRCEDREAAQVAGLGFLFAGWGYGGPPVDGSSIGGSLVDGPMRMVEAVDEYLRKAGR